MTTQTDLTPSQAAFKFLNDLFLDPILLAAYSEKCWSLNGAKNADEILTGWLGKLGYPGATPALVYAALQFWQCQGLWLWQGEYNQNFYYPPDSESQANQYTLKILPNDGDLQATLNGEVLNYSLIPDKGYLTLSWDQGNGNSSNGSIVFYYSPSFGVSADTVVKYAGNFFNGYLNGNPFKGALLSQPSQTMEGSEEVAESQNPKHFSVASTVILSVIGSVILGGCVGYGYMVYASNNYKYPFADRRNMISELQSEAKTLAEKVKNVYSFKTKGGDIKFEETFPEYSKFLKDFNPDEISPGEVDRLLKTSESDEFLKEMGVLNNTDLFQTSRLKRYLYDLKSSKDPSVLPAIQEKERAQSLSSVSSEDVFEQVENSQTLSSDFAANPESLGFSGAAQSVENAGEQLRNADDDDDLDSEKVFDEVEADLAEDLGGAG